MSFQEQLKNARRSKGYTQYEVANLMGITASTYCGYETGKRQPDINKIRELAEILDVSIDVLLESPSVERDILAEVDIGFYGAYSELSEEDKETIRKMVEIMRERRKDKK